jgi:ketosteroid isomerase-like protein
MQARNRDVIGEIYERYAKGDAGPLFAALADDVVWYTEGIGLPWSGHYTGPAGVQDYFAKLTASCELRGYEIEHLLADDTWVMALATVHIHIRSTGRTDAFRKVDAIRLRDGRIVEFREYYDSARAAAALAGGAA